MTPNLKFKMTNWRICFLNLPYVQELVHLDPFVYLHQLYSQTLAVQMSNGQNRTQTQVPNAVYRRTLFLKTVNLKTFDIACKFITTRSHCKENIFEKKWQSMTGMPTKILITSSSNTNN